MDIERIARMHHDSSRQLDEKTSEAPPPHKVHIARQKEMDNLHRNGNLQIAEIPEVRGRGKHSRCRFVDTWHGVARGAATFVVIRVGYQCRIHICGIATRRGNIRNNAKSYSELGDC
eukprot:1645664-Amphidinium_carterae.1